MIAPDERILIQQELIKLKEGLINIHIATFNIEEIIEIISKRRILVDFTKYIEDDFDDYGALFPNVSYIDKYLKVHNWLTKQNKNMVLLGKAGFLDDLTEEEFNEKLKEL